MKLEVIEAAVVDWFMQVVIPTFPWYYQFGAGFKIPALLKQLEDSIANNTEMLKSVGALTDNGFDVENLRNALCFTFKYHEKIQVDVEGIKFYVTKTNVDEILNTAIKLAQNRP